MRAARRTGALNAFITADIVGGDFTLGFTGTGDQGPHTAIAYNSSHTLNVMTAGNFVMAASVQNAGSGAINLVAGWDGHTLAPASFGNAGVYGNNGKGVMIGGANAAGNVAIGSAGGTTSVYGASLALSALQRLRAARLQRPRRGRDPGQDHRRRHRHRRRRHRPVRADRQWRPGDQRQQQRRHPDHRPAAISC